MAVETDWVEKLIGEPAIRDAALSELRELLQAKLRRAFANAGEEFVEDVTQDALLKIHDRLAEFQGRSKFTTWALTIAIRVGYTELRRLRWKDVSLDQLAGQAGDGASEQSGPQNEPVATVARKQIVDELHSIINDKLTPKQRQVLQAELGGMPQEEIGRRLGSKRNAVYKLMHDARKRLKKELEQRGYSQEDLGAG